MKITVSTEQEEKFPALYINKDFLSGQSERVIILVEQEYEDHYVGTVLQSYDIVEFPVASRTAIPKEDFVRFNGTVSLQND